VEWIGVVLMVMVMSEGLGKGRGEVLLVV